jgi:hypothetical protein
MITITVIKIGRKVTPYVINVIIKNVQLLY